MADPSKEDAATFVNFTGASAQRYKTIENATNAYLDNNGVLPEETQQHWEDGKLQGDTSQPYGPENHPKNSFNIQSADSLNPGILEGMYSRPPSRVSNYGTHQDLSEEQQVQQAISMSMSQTLPGQESGVLTNSGANFGPAKQEYYDTKNWAMTVPSFQTREHLQNPEPEDRKREDGAPAFMKPAFAAQFLPPLITILHAIPMAKEALLARDISLPDYGTSSDWWDGNPIQGPKIVFIDNPSESSEWEEIIFECQRLMAFLEQTQRAYGSVENLLQIEGVHNGSTDMLADFLSSWQGAIGRAQPDYRLGQIFTSSAINDPAAVAAGEEANARLTEITFTTTDQCLLLGGSLYDALDGILWPTVTSEDNITNVYFEFGEILIMKPTASDPSVGLGIDIPATFYPDRYQDRSGETIRKIQSGRIALIKKLQEAEEMQHNLTTLHHPREGEKTVDASKMLDIAVSYLSQSPDRNCIINKFQSNKSLIDIDAEEIFNYGDVANQLQSVSASVIGKLNTLQNLKAEALKELKELSNLYKQPHVLSTATHKYSLRGIATDYSTTYVLANPNTAEDLIDTEVEDWQWWRIRYSSASEQPVSWRKVLETDVLEAARSDSTTALLVYASDKAVHYPTQPLPTKLRNFARVDNLAFARELDVSSLRNSRTAKEKMTSNGNSGKDADSHSDLPNWGGYMEEEMTDAPDACSKALENPVEPYQAEPPPYGQTWVPQMPTRPLSVLDIDLQANGSDDEKELTQPKGVEYSKVDLLGDGDKEQVQEMKQLRATQDSKGSLNDLRDHGQIGVVPGGIGPGVGEDAKGDYVAEIQSEDLEGDIDEH